MATSNVFYDRTSAEYKFYSTIACVDLLRGLAAKESWDEILAHSTIIKEYLEHCANSSKAVYETSFNGLRQLYTKYAACDAEECQQGIRDIIDLYTEERGSRVPHSYIQRDFARLMGYLAEKYECHDVFEPFAGKATFAEFLPQDTTYIGQEINPQLCMLANLRLESQYRQNSSVEHTDSLTSFRHSDMIMSEMPWGVRLPNRQTCENYFLQEASYHARKISVGIYPYGILFRDNKEKTLRRELVESDLIDCVIKLPARLYAPYSGVQTCIIITNRQKRNEGYVRFIDASSFVIPEKAYTRLDVERLIQVIQNPEFESSEAIWVRQDAILANDANLAVERYQPIDLPEIPEGSKLVSLNELLVRISTRKPTEETMVPVVRVSDLAVNPLDRTLTSFKVERRPYRRECFYVNEPAIFISRIGSLKPTGYIEDGRESGRGVYLSPDVYAFRIVGEVYTPYLLNELTKDYVQKQLMYAGSYIQTLTVQDFLTVQILLPSFEEQKLSVLQGIKERGEQTIAEARTAFDAEMRQRAHTLGHPITDIVRLCRNLADLMGQQGGMLHADDIVNRKGETVKEQMEKLLYASKRAASLNEHFMFAREFGEPQSIILYDFVADFIRQHDIPKFKPTFRGRSQEFRVLFAKEDLTTVLDNIFTNIGKHSFPDEVFSPENKVVIDIQGCELNGRPAVSLLIMSNGEPLAAAMTPESVFMFGPSSSKDPNHGFGGNQIKMAVEHFRGEVSFLTEGNLMDGFNTAYRIVLPLISA